MEVAPCFSGRDPDFESGTVQNVHEEKKMKLKDLVIKNLALCALALFAAGCASVDYVGETYAPTDYVDMYFDAQDIHRPHKVMGQLTLDEGEYTDSQDMQAEMKKEAMARGADAVLFTGLRTIETGSVTEWQDTGKTKGKHKYDHGTATTRVQREKEMTGSLVKYTDLTPSQYIVPAEK